MFPLHTLQSCTPRRDNYERSVCIWQWYDAVRMPFTELQRHTRVFVLPWSSHPQPVDQLATGGAAGPDLTHQALRPIQFVAGYSCY